MPTWIAIILEMPEVCKLVLPYRDAVPFFGVLEFSVGSGS
jgi:hypothetical protein